MRDIDAAHRLNGKLTDTSRDLAPEIVLEFEVESVSSKEMDDEAQPVRRRTDHRDIETAPGGAWGEGASHFWLSRFSSPIPRRASQRECPLWGVKRAFGWSGRNDRF
jgi:hypothetical protein